MRFQHLVNRVDHHGALSTPSYTKILNRRPSVVSSCLPLLPLVPQYNTPVYVQQQQMAAATASTAMNMVSWKPIADLGKHVVLLARADAEPSCW
jgi:hypothetical protein